MVDRVEAVGCTVFDVVEFGDLKTLRAENTDQSCEHGGVEFNDGERSSSVIVLGLVTESVGSEAGISRLGGLVAVASLANLVPSRPWSSIGFGGVGLQAVRLARTPPKRLGRRELTLSAPRTHKKIQCEGQIGKTDG
jgi:hypothetical protein